MKIVIDTHVLFWYLIPQKKLKLEIIEILRNAEQIFVPTIVLLELFYTMKKLKIAGQFKKLLKTIKTSRQYTITTLDLVVVEEVAESGGLLEMHDNIILTTAKSLKLPLVTKDPEIQKVYKNTIW